MEKKQHTTHTRDLSQWHSKFLVSLWNSHTSEVWLFQVKPQSVWFLVSHGALTTLKKTDTEATAKAELWQEEKLPERL